MTRRKADGTSHTSASAWLPRRRTSAIPPPARTHQRQQPAPVTVQPYTFIRAAPPQRAPTPTATPPATHIAHERERKNGSQQRRSVRREQGKHSNSRAGQAACRRNTTASVSSARRRTIYRARLGVYRSDTARHGADHSSSTHSLRSVRNNAFPKLPYSCKPYTTPDRAPLI